jgi:peptidoglycan/xylan/chitin deacetylase (PgdA/CDA1 family)
MFINSHIPGALVISLDLELHWGVRDRRPLDENERKRLLSARAAVLRIVELFEEFSVRATWATVGFLFARSREELLHFSPSMRPHYHDPALDPYREQTGRDESDDPFHFAPGLIDAIAVHKSQEIATHSFSHYYCCEPGQGPEEFKADLRSALAIARYSGHHIRSYVFPRNQVNSDYLPVLKRAGLSAYRGTQASAVNAAAAFRIQRRIHRRMLRLCDNYVDLYGPQTNPWPEGSEPYCIGASRYLRPCSQLLKGLESLRHRRIAVAMQSAAERGELFHLWWHPEDFAGDCDSNLRFLRRVLADYDRCRRQSGMLSLSMSEAARFACDESAPVPANAMKEAI